ncbi:hypothetical protein GW17_00013814 [Ensete ventricosum]|nr:hypothetical protein GW17_00013814 [Ensete ventricosum]
MSDTEKCFGRDDEESEVKCRRRESQIVKRPPVTTRGERRWVPFPGRKEEGLSSSSRSLLSGGRFYTCGLRDHRTKIINADGGALDRPGGMAPCRVLPMLADTVSGQLTLCQVGGAVPGADMTEVT